MKIFAGVVTKIMRVCASSTTMTAPSQEELAQFLGLNRLLRSIRLETFATLIHCVELVLSSPSHFIIATAAILAESIKLLLTAHAVPATAPHKAASAPSVTEAAPIVAEPVPTEALVTTTGVEPTVVVAATGVV